MLCYFWPGLLCFYSVQSTWELLWMDSNINLSPGNRSLITWVNTCQIKGRYLPSFHFWDSGSWYVLYIPLLLFFCYFLCLLVDLCVAVFFSCLLTVAWATKNKFQSFYFLSHWSLNFIIIIMFLHYIMLLICIMVDYFILLYHYDLFSIVFIILFLFSFSKSYYFYFHRSNSSYPVLHLLFYLAFVLLYWL